MAPWSQNGSHVTLGETFSDHLYFGQICNSTNTGPGSLSYRRSVFISRSPYFRPYQSMLLCDSCKCMGETWLFMQFKNKIMLDYTSRPTLDLLTVGPKCTQPACRASVAVRLLIDIDCPRLTSAANPPAAYGTDGRRRPFYEAYRILRGLHNNLNKTWQAVTELI